MTTKGLKKKYRISKADGRPTNGRYFVLKVDSKDKKHARAYIKALEVYALEIQAFQRNVGQQAQRLQPSTHQTQAVRAARKMLRNSGELTIKGTDNRIRAKDTVPEGNDPHPPEG